ncbi:PQQ-binding-like beta-propeller repeat protein [Halorussus aquaticus]|uniref:PQQ-binding-like beta-propeller repeat protein n=1 Tax=Halorussus aquaticus TaxID=2953748 RepID=A0ABD5Q1P4_9EURY|nr:PQQ-binding-like beta-propeller repeat protein [Halorussus aquaticus]
MTTATGVTAALAVGPVPALAAQAVPDWTATLGGVPGECVVHGNAVFVADTSGSVTAFDTADGAVRGTTATGKDMVSVGASDSYVAAGAKDGSLYSIDRESMTDNWHRSLSAYVNGVTVAGTVAYAVTEDGECYAIDLDSGETKWRETLSGENPAAPVVGEYVYARSGGEASSGAVYAFDPDSGATEWQVSIASGENAYAVDADLALSPDGRHLAANYLRGEEVAGVTLFDAADGTEQWSARSDGDGVGAVAVGADRVVYEGDQRVFGHDRATGEQKWQSGQGVAGGLTYDAGRLFYVADFGDQEAVRGTRSDTGIVTWETEKEYLDIWGGDASATHYYALHEDGIKAYRRKKTVETTESTTREATTESTRTGGGTGGGTERATTARATTDRTETPRSTTASSATTEAPLRDATTVASDGRGLFVAGDGVLRGNVSTWMLTVSGFALSVVGLVYSMRKEN